ncbi:leucine rich repeat domain containing protein [Acanthamoeba castellanii str. Neff]|uniref:Leucine rich repeat domain containing protein n=1 Tax=Acanthamoeba castellanii (strain ATCC 30010 / Neff) TaxID=1257118 RepID=L8HGM0_ACACF|nr:leucine rich repeat domain containing protein [Acanthamoeba castellanii str. Neff]ELR24684.1 leucine rich repeat domain containing protein [Acanthamoeba castellanii str. Neff]
MGWPHTFHNSSRCVSLRPSLAKLTQLRSLDVSGCRSDKAVPFELLGALAGLRSLNLNYTSVDDAQLAEIVRCCTELTHLQLSRCAQLVRGATFRQVLTGLPRLESLIASNNASVSVDSFCAPAPADGETMSTTPTPLSLTELDVSGCVWITDAALAALCRLLPSLTSLALTKCHSITDWSPLTADARGGLASSLAHLKINGTGVNDAALAVIVRGLPALTTINLMDCRGITPAGLACFADGAPALQDLKLNWRGYRAALQELRGRRPDLHATTK